MDSGNSSEVVAVVVAVSLRSSITVSTPSSCKLDSGSGEASNIGVMSLVLSESGVPLVPSAANLHLKKKSLYGI